MHRRIETAQAPAPAGAYAQGVVANGFLYTAGQGPYDPTGQIGNTIQEQTAQVLQNLQAILAEEGLDLSDVVKVTAHLQDLKGDFAGYDEVYREFFNGPLPCRTTVGSNLMDIRVEIDIVAALR